MSIHMQDERERAQVPPSGSGKIQRAQAGALLWEMDHKSKPSPPLFRGDHEDPRGAQPWTSVEAIAAKWAAKNGGQVFTRPAGTRGLRIADYLGSDPEKEWIIRA